MNRDPTVFIVDDDAAVRRALSRLAKSVDLPAEVFSSPQAFLESYDPAWPGCLVLDLKMPGMSGLELQAKLKQDGVQIPTIIISAHGDVEKAVQAMKSGAVDFISKPYKAKILLARIRMALALDAEQRRKKAEHDRLTALMSRLTPREHEVARHLADGKASKWIGFKLGLSSKTLDIHRQHVMTKLQCESAVELSRIVRELSIGRGGAAWQSGVEDATGSSLADSS